MSLVVALLVAVGVMFWPDRSGVRRLAILAPADVDRRAGPEILDRVGVGARTAVETGSRR